MIRCWQLRPLLGRVANGEAGPREALRVARHLHGCTGCRIVLARERRLSDILAEGLGDIIAVGAEFAGRVMQTLPPQPRWRQGRRSRAHRQR